jgi:RNA polymerase sigma factor (TIGR02999 family)
MAAEQADGPGEVTHLLDFVRAGDRAALDRLLPLVYDELRQLARHQLRHDVACTTLQATDLVHEAYFKLVGSGPIDAANRAHFLAIGSRAMRQVLVDRARRRGAEKRGGEWERAALTEGHAAADLDSVDLLVLSDALEQLEPRQRQVVEYRFFAGMEDQEIAAVLGVTDRTVRRDWVKARAWLFRALFLPSQS